MLHCDQQILLPQHLWRLTAPVFADGVSFIELSAGRDPDLVLPTITYALGVADQGTRPLLEQIAAQLRRRQLLLVLDNFEQVIEAAPLVADLLTRCPQVKVVATRGAKEEGPWLRQRR